MQLTARVLIVSRDDAVAHALGAGLDRADWRSIVARGVHSALLALEDLPIEAVILVGKAGFEEEDRETARRLKSARAPRRLPVLALGRPTGEPEDHAAFDLALAPPLAPAQAVQRLKHLLRAALAEEEMELRRRTFAARGHLLDAPELDPSPIRVLTIGEPAPQFLGLSHTLKARGAEVVAAFSAYTGFDYLHDRAFDATVLWAGEGSTEALSIAGGIRRNSRLFHLPTILYLRTSQDMDLDEAFRRGLSDAVTADIPEREAALRVLTLAQTYRRETAIRRALERARGSGLMDATTGLFTRELFASHLARLALASRDGRRPLSLAVLRLAHRPELQRARLTGGLDRAMPQIGSMIGRLVRAEDTPAHIAPEMFALALPGATAAAAQAAAERIAAVIACTAFQTGDGQPAFTVEFKVGAAEFKPGETVVQTLERAAVSGAARRAG